MTQEEVTSQEQELKTFLDRVLWKLTPHPERKKFDYEMWELTPVADLIYAHPGAAKSKLTTEIANGLWEETSKDGKGQPTLYLMLTHQAIKDRLKHIKDDGKLELWNHYEGHRKTCRISKWASLGYTGAKCDCRDEDSNEKLTDSKPTLAAIDNIFLNPLSNWPTQPAVAYFPLWIVDEVDFGRFIETRKASENDLRSVVKHYPGQTNPQDGTPLDLGPVKSLAQALLIVLDDMKENEESRLNGVTLYERLNSALADNSTVQQLATELAPLIGHLPTGRWANKGKGNPQNLHGQPRNFPPYLVPIFCEEATAYQQGKHFNPRIHLLNRDKGPCLLMKWRRRVVDRCLYLEGGGEVTYDDLLLLDATANEDLIGRVFPDLDNVYKPGLPDWRPNVHVHQWGDSVVSQTDLGRNFEHDSEDDDGYDQAKLKVWFARIRDALDTFDRSLSVGVITHKAIHEQLQEAVGSWGFKTVRSMYFHNLRGSNAFESSRILVVLGCPIPNLTGFEEECQAFLYDENEPLNFHRNNGKQELQMRDGRKYPVQPYGCWKSLAAAYYWQKCQAELFQAVHRIRPYRPQKYERHIFLFTNMPVDGVKVEEVIPGTGSWQCTVAQKVKEQLTNQKEVTVREIATLVADAGDKLRSVEKRIADNGEAIAILADAWYHHGTRGKGGTSNRFAKSPT